jgi:hypothetical protein
MMISKRLKRVTVVYAKIETMILQAYKLILLQSAIPKFNNFDNLATFVSI